MLGLRSIAAKLFGTTNDRKVVKYRAPVEEINLLEAEFAALSDADLKAKTASFKAEIAGGVFDFDVDLLDAVGKRWRDDRENTACVGQADLEKRRTVEQRNECAG